MHDEIESFNLCNKSLNARQLSETESQTASVDAIYIHCTGDRQLMCSDYSGDIIIQRLIQNIELKYTMHLFQVNSLPLTQHSHLSAM